MTTIEYSLMKYVAGRLKNEMGVELLGNVRNGRIILPADEERGTVKVLKCTFHPNLLESCKITEIPASMIFKYIREGSYHGESYYDNDMLIITLEKQLP